MDNPRWSCLNRISIMFWRKRMTLFDYIIEEHLLLTTSHWNCGHIQAKPNQVKPKPWQMRLKLTTTVDTEPDKETLQYGLSALDRISVIRLLRSLNFWSSFKQFAFEVTEMICRIKFIRWFPLSDCIRCVLYVGFRFRWTLW